MTVQISVETLSPITHNQIPVVTTELIAQLYGTERQRITNNFNRNKERFVEGKHYFMAKGEALENLKNSLRDFQTIAPNVRKLILWTERGAARHAKMLETDQAWEVFEKLEDCYFCQKRPTSAPEPIIEGDCRTLVIRFDEQGNIKDSQTVPNSAWVCTIENFKFFLEQQGWTLINLSKIKRMTVEQLLALK
ncbi:ORF6N domain-containing protein [Salmonella enterica subsp. enterica]|nr:ORF6N domain-containing protein [Salmonella enterica subsp. enterica]EGB0328026.1 ORF6N domain-containing protein [Salmonella enterica]HEC8456649.1 ORF6N domain-containing protein [Salmonella enterica subsp. enterica serovar Poona]HEC8685188.1 ORF6N domain-containing protein [Salmonella enterica subsp. enterica serovar Oranienburg]EHK2735946.1 ORF6N domain-containing protein [Salmonella enterica]